MTNVFEISDNPIPDPPKPQLTEERDLTGARSEENTAPRWRMANTEQVVFCHDAPTGLRVIIAIYSTALGPALGGTPRAGNGRA